MSNGNGSGGQGKGKGHLFGGRGDDVYFVDDAGDVVREHKNGGTDTVFTGIGYTLPKNVENLIADNAYVAGDQRLVGNKLDNHIVGAPFSYETILGLDGNDTLDGGGRQGGMLDGGNGDDILINSFGDDIGGAGADTFVAGGRGAMTTPDTPIVVHDFNAAEGDRLSFGRLVLPGSPAELFASGELRFEAETGRLVLDLAPAGGVDQVFMLVGVQSFDPSWIV